MALAKLVEDKLHDQRSRQHFIPSHFSPPALPAPNQPPTSTPLLTPMPPLLPIPTRLPTNIPYTRLSLDTLQKCRAAGLCFRCPEKSHPGHKCNPPQFLLIVDNDDTPTSYTPTDSNETLLEPSTSDPFNHTFDTFTPDLDTHFLSLSTAALLGLASPKALRMTGHIHGHPVTILVDTGSTHNIVQPHVASFLKLPTQNITSFPVMIGNGMFLHCMGFCPSVPLHLQNTTFHIPFFVLPVEGADIILGMAWLSSLGPLTTDFSIPQISFHHQDSPIILRGQAPTLVVSPSSLHHLIQIDVVASMHAIIFHHISYSSTSAPLSNSDSQIQHLLTTYTHLFEPPKQLPPSRTHDHHIPTDPIAAPINVKSYRYPNYQKRDHPTHPEPVLLTRLVGSKKEGTWRFCVDYRALNAITVWDRFPILTVDELLDELHGASIFSKIEF